MNDLEKYNEKVFEKIKHIDEKGNEYWEARELQHLLEYKEWRKFNGVIEKTIEACKKSKINASEHFVSADKMVDIGSGAKRRQEDFRLSRYALLLNCSKWR